MKDQKLKNRSLKNNITNTKSAVLKQRTKPTSSKKTPSRNILQTKLRLKKALQKIKQMRQKRYYLKMRLKRKRRRAFLKKMNMRGYAYIQRRSSRRKKSIRAFALTPVVHTLKQRVCFLYN